MAIPSKQIGWGTESNLLWSISKQLEYLTKVTATTSDVTVVNNALNPVPVTVENIVNIVDVNTVKPYKHISLASTNATLIKNQITKLYVVSAIGLTSTVRYLKFYDTSVAPIVGTDIPVLTIPVPSNTQGAGIVIPFNTPINFNNGLAFAITSGSANNDTGIVGAGDVIVNLTYA
jgi:hypothetical protein